jgi:hypothetical protein
MEFNVKKILSSCNLEQKQSSKRTFNYTMKGEPLEIVNHHPYLGVELSDKMKYNT